MMKTGTREWAEITKNMLRGCSNNCRYCYAKYNAIRFKQIHNSRMWGEPVLNKKKFKEKPKKYEGKRIMFPSSHDILIDFLDESTEYLLRWLDVGNHVLIVSKPRLKCIERLCGELGKYKKQVVFRFTIGSIHDHVLKFWEPNAPHFRERVDSLKHALDEGFETSVSCEPYLDYDTHVLIDTVLPLVTDTVWVGKMNRMYQRIERDGWGNEEWDYFHIVKNAQKYDKIVELYERYKDNQKVRWKDSIKKDLGLPEEETG